MNSNLPLSLRVQRAAMTAAGHVLARVAADRGQPAASVLIATRNRATYLNLTLTALSGQCFPRRSWEVVVVNESSDDETSDVLARHRGAGRMAVECLVAPRGSRGAALNRGIKAARGAVVVLLGDDRIVEPGFLLRHLAHHLDRPCVVMGDSHRAIHTHVFPGLEPSLPGIPPQPALAPEELDRPDQWMRGAFEQGGNPAPLFEYFRVTGVENPYPWAHFDGGNASVRREDLLRVGGFEASRPEGSRDWPGLADQDLALRLYAARIPFQFVPHACALRQVSPRMAVPRGEWTLALRALGRRHPEIGDAPLEALLFG